VNKDIFSYLVAHPFNISLTDVKTVEAITNQYPYCQLAHTLLAKGYHTQYAEELAFEKIRQASAHALSRNALRKVINGSFKNEQVASFQGKFESEYLHKFNENSENQVVNHISEISDQDILMNSPVVEDYLIDEIAQRKQLQNSIIDSFLTKDPGLIRTTKSQLEAMGKQEDLSVGSVRLEKGIVTESYAKILTMQGRKDKAIEVYEKLILKFPEKKAYFASKIQELA
jgi:disulfide oxidoreductase YuzD